MLKGVVRLPCSADEIAETQPAKRCKLFENVMLRDITTPMVLCSKDNVLLIWYLPGAISVYMQVYIENYAEIPPGRAKTSRVGLSMPHDIYKLNLNGPLRALGIPTLPQRHGRQMSKILLCNCAKQLLLLVLKHSHLLGKLRVTM